MAISTNARMFEMKIYKLFRNSLKLGAIFALAVVVPRHSGNLDLRATFDDNMM